MGRLAWGRAQKDSTRATLVPGRGASTIRGNPGRDRFVRCFQGLPYLAPGVSHFGRHPYQYGMSHFCLCQGLLHRSKGQHGAYWYPIHGSPIHC
eukprot:1150964-Pelagomonas_calceolata.AAC.3